MTSKGIFENIYAEMDKLEIMMRKNNNIIMDMNILEDNSNKIAKNPLKKVAFTYGEYNNWMKLNPGFTWLDYVNYCK